MSHLPCLLFPPGLVDMMLIGKPASGTLLAGFLLLWQKTWPDKKQSEEESFLLAQGNMFHLGTNGMAIAEQEDGWLATLHLQTGREVWITPRSIIFILLFRSGSQSREWRGPHSVDPPETMPKACLLDSLDPMKPTVLTVTARHNYKGILIPWRSSMKKSLLISSVLQNLCARVRYFCSL